MWPRKPTLHATLRKNYTGSRPMVPHPLPIAHVAPARHFAKIVANGFLKPTRCDVFGDDRLYLYYGGVYYRSSIHATRMLERLPVAFLFDPAALKNLACCYPFDTGAVVKAKFGEIWKEKLSPIRRFKVKPTWGVRTGSVITDVLYVDNKNYLDGKVDPSCTRKDAPLPLLYQFLTADLSVYDADQRQTATECQYVCPLELNSSSGLLWVGYPNALQAEFIRICDRSYPSVPRCYAYSYRTPFRPAELEAKLETAAREEIERFV